MALAALIPALLPFLSRVLDKAIPDPKAREDAKLEMTKALYEGESRELEAMRDVVVAEVQGHSKIQRVWRPIAMLTFLFLIVWIAVFAPMLGMAEESVSALERVPTSLWSLIMIGMGGYIAGRSAEKIAGSIFK